MSVAGIILAAGASRRLGRPKQAVILHNETLLQRAIRVAHAARLSPLAVVIADEILVAEVRTHGAIALLNPESHEGMASSIRTGVRWAQQSGAAGAVLMTCDQVAVTPEHLAALCERTDEPAGSAYAGKIGVPAYFPAAMFQALLELRGDIGARHLLVHARAIPTEALAFDIDTEEDLLRARTAKL